MTIEIQGIVKDVLDNQHGRVWSIILMMVPWRVVGEEVEVIELRAEWRVGLRSKFDKTIRRFKEGTPVRVTASHVAKSRGWCDARDVAEIVVDKSARALEDLVEDAEPVVVDDKVLGKLEFDEGYGNYVRWRRVAGSQYELAIEPLRSGTPEQHVARARPIVKRIEAGLTKVYAAAAARIVRTYNAHWREDRRELTAAAIAKRLQLTALSVSPRNVATLHLSAGDLFGDHAVEVTINTRGTVSAVSLA